MNNFNNMHANHIAVEHLGKKYIMDYINTFKATMPFYSINNLWKSKHNDKIAFPFNIRPHFIFFNVSIRFRLSSTIERLFFGQEINKSKLLTLIKKSIK